MNWKKFISNSMGFVLLGGFFLMIITVGWAIVVGLELESDCSDFCVSEGLVYADLENGDCFCRDKGVNMSYIKDLEV